MFRRSEAREPRLWGQCDKTAKPIDDAEGEKLKGRTSKLAPIRTELLSEFDFGDPEAKADRLLLECPQKIRGVREFLTGNKNIVLGERGAGKSALFRLLCEGHYEFKSDQSDKARKQLVVGIDDDLNYSAVANAIESRFIDKAKRPHGKHRFLWEVYVLVRVLERIEDEFGSDEELNTLRADLGAVLGTPKERTIRLSTLLTSFKLTAGAKVDQAGSITPTVSIEPARDSSAAHEVTDHEIASFRERVRKAIKTRRAVVHVLIDKIDDFVVGLDYEEQKKSVQALLELSQQLRYPELKLKVFLRADIFKRLDFEKIGYDKVITQVVNLVWDTEDVFAFMARRIHHNLSRLDVPLPSWRIDVEALNIDPSIRDQAKDLFRKQPKGVSDIAAAIAKGLVLLSKMRWNLFRRHPRSERATSALDEASRKIVSFLFPVRISHVNSQCKPEEVTLRDFISESFRLGGVGPNPRLVIMFLKYTIEESVTYYEKNPDPACREISPNEVDEYEIILNEHIDRGYRRLQQTTRDTVIQLSSGWRADIARLLQGINPPKDCSGLGVKRIRELTQWASSEEELRRFVAFYNHVGVFRLETEDARFDDRAYSLPAVLRICPRNKAQPAKRVNSNTRASN